jgi:hypothetical protein
VTKEKQMKLVRLTDSRLHSALQRLGAASVPLRVAFKLKGIQARVDEELKKFEQCRQEALAKLGKKDAEGNLLTKSDGAVEFDPEQMQLFVKELNELGETEVNLPSINISELGDKIEFTANDLFILDGILVE